MCFFFSFNLKQCVKKNQPKKNMHKTKNLGSTNWLNQKRSLGTQQNVTIFLQYIYF